MIPETPLVLVVEDEEDLREELLELLAMRGFRVLGASDVEEATRLLRSAPGPLSLLSDLRLPGGSGLDLIRLVASDTELTSKVVRTLLMTGHTDLTEQVELELARLDVAILFKPIQAARLVSLVSGATEVAPRPWAV